MGCHTAFFLHNRRFEEAACHVAFSGVPFFPAEVFFMDNARVSSRGRLEHAILFLIHFFPQHFLSFKSQFIIKSMRNIESICIGHVMFI